MRKRLSKAYDLAVEAGRPDLQARARGLKGNVLAATGKFDEGIETVHTGLSLALHHNLPEAASRAAYHGLTRRQVEILRLITEGLTNKEIASKLYLSPRTVEMHVANILDRLNCRSRTQAVRKAEEMGL